MWGLREPLSELWDPLISAERMKLETSNLTQIWRKVSTYEKNAKLYKKGSRGVTCHTFAILGYP